MKIIKPLNYKTIRKINICQVIDVDVNPAIGTELVKMNKNDEIKSIDVNDIGELIEVPSDGNCDYHVLLYGLKLHNTRYSPILSNMNTLRKEIYGHGIKNYDRLKELDVYEHIKGIQGVRLK